MKLFPPLRSILGKPRPRPDIVELAAKQLAEPPKEQPRRAMHRMVSRCLAVADAQFLGVR